MSDKGGKKEQESLIDLKMVLTAIVGVLLGAVFVMTLIFAGMIISERYYYARMASTQTEKITDVVPIEFESKSYHYYPAVNGGDNEGYFESLLRVLGTNKSYYVISTQAEYETVVRTINSLGGEASTSDFDLPNDYFNSSSLILVTAEMRGLSQFHINSITRNEGYDLRIDVSAADAYDTVNVDGRAIIIKVPNIQPENIVVVRRTE